MVTTTTGLSGLLDEEEGALIDLMICTIKQAALVVPPVGRSHGKKVLLTDKCMIPPCSLLRVDFGSSPVVD